MDKLSFVPLPVRPHKSPTTIDFILYTRNGNSAKCINLLLQNPNCSFITLPLSPPGNQRTTLTFFILPMKRHPFFHHLIPNPEISCPENTPTSTMSARRIEVRQHRQTLPHLQHHGRGEEYANTHNHTTATTVTAPSPNVCAPGPPKVRPSHSPRNDVPSGHVYAPYPFCEEQPEKTRGL